MPNSEPDDAQPRARPAPWRVAPEAYAQILLAVALTFYALCKLRNYVDPWGLSDPLGPVSALEAIEAAILFGLCRRMHGGAVAVEEVCIAVLALGVAAAMGGPRLAFELAAVGFAVRFLRWPGAGPAVCGMTILCAQGAAMASPLLDLHGWSGPIDAAVVRWVTGLCGYGTAGAGARVIGPEGGITIEIYPLCTSSFVAAHVLAGYALILLWRRGRLAWGDLSGAAALVTLVTLANWARLAPMAFSREAHAFWHDDLGAQLVALLDGALTCGLALRAAADRGVRIPAAGTADGWTARVWRSGRA